MEEAKENKSVVTSYRINQDTKDKIKKQLDDLGLTQEQYFNQVISIMEMENVKKNNMFAVNTTELQDLTQRISNLFIGLCDQGNSFLKNKDTELEGLKTKYKDMLSNKEGSITSLKDELQYTYNKLDVLQSENNNNKNELESIRSEYNKQIEQLESNLVDKTSLIEEYKNKNDMLLTDLTEYKQYKTEVEEYKNLLEDNQSRIFLLNESIKNKDITIKELTSNIENLKQENEKKLGDLKDKLLFEKESEILKLKQEQYKHVEELKNKYDLEIEKKNKIIEEMNAKYHKEMEEYQEKYKELLNIKSNLEK